MTSTVTPLNTADASGWFNFMLTETDASPVVLSFLAMHEDLLLVPEDGLSPRLWGDVSLCLQDSMAKRIAPSLLLMPVMISVAARPQALFLSHVIDVLGAPPPSTAAIVEREAVLERTLTNGQALFVVYEALTDLQTRRRNKWGKQLLGYRVGVLSKWIETNLQKEVADVFFRHLSRDMPEMVDSAAQLLSA